MVFRLGRFSVMGGMRIAYDVHVESRSHARGLSRFSPY